MGKGVSIQCDECGYSATLFEGVGIRTKDFEAFVKALNEKDREFITYITNKGTTEEVIYQNAYGKCDRCEDLATINYIKIRYDKDKTFTLDNKCHVCEGIYKPITLEEVEESSCPICNNKRFNSFMTMDWD